LHDLGKIVLNLKDAALYQNVKTIIKSSVNSNILEIEKLYYGTDHCQMGSLLAKRWQLPLLINNAIKYHHTPNTSSMPIPCTLVYLVDSLVKDDFNPDNLDPEIMKNLSIQIDEPQLLRENIIAKAQVLLAELSN